MVKQVALRNKAKELATILDSSILKPYNKSIKRFKPELRQNLGKFGESEMQLTGASDLMNVYLANSGLLPKDARIATREDLKTAISRADNFLSKFYVCFGLNLVTPENGEYQINTFLANSLAKELKKVGVDLKNAKLIPYNILTWKTLEKSPYGLVFKLSKEGKDIAKKLVLNTDDFEWNYTSRGSGLFRACLYRDDGWDAWVEGLAGSYSGGRVVVVSGEATSQKFLKRYFPKFEREEAQAIVDINEKYAKMRESLRVR